MTPSDPILKPCPFCGGAAIIKRAKTVMVSCTGCTASTFQLLDDRHSAIAAWNRRGSSTSTSQAAAPALEADCEPSCGYIGAECNFPACKTRAAPGDALDAAFVSSKLERYAEESDCCGGTWVVPAEKGEYVRFEDVLAAIAASTAQDGKS